jgi:hypothetical protein
VAGSALVAASVVSTVFLASKFMLVSIQTPAQTAVGMLVDRFFFIGLSMVTLALASVGVWHAMAIDERDAAILGHLPLPYAMVVRAKLNALAIFALVFVAILNVFSSAAYPIAAVDVLPLRMIDVLVLSSTQFGVCVLAGLFGFISVLAIRETLRLIAGPRRFTRISSIAQAVLLVLLGTALLLLPGAMSNAPTWLASPDGMARVNPVLWFLGLNEWLSGHVLGGLSSSPLYPSVVVALEQRAAARLAAIAPLTSALAARALISLGIVFVLAMAAYLWNSRSLPLGVPLRARRRSHVGRFGRAVAVRMLRAPATRAGFFFTMKAMWRSAPHRVALATAAGAAIATSTLLLGNISFDRIRDVPAVPASVFGLPVVAAGLIAMGFRHAMQVPAELRAGWILQLCWSGDERAYLSGVKWAGIVTAALPALAATLWVAPLTLPWNAAVATGAFAALFTLWLFDVVAFRLGTWPFASPYAAEDNVAELAPVYALGFIFVTFALAQLQRAAFETPVGTASLLIAALLAVIILRYVDAQAYPGRNVETWNRTLVDTGRVNLSGVDW